MIFVQRLIFNFQVLIFFGTFISCTPNKESEIPDLHTHLEEREEYLKIILLENLNDDSVKVILGDLNSATINLILSQKNERLENLTVEELLINIDQLKEIKQQIANFNIFDYLYFFALDFIVFEILIFFLLFLISITASHSKLLEAYISISGLLSITIIGIVNSLFFDIASMILPSSKENLIHNSINDLNKPLVQFFENSKR